MYGMIHNAARALVTRQYGEAAWASIIQKCGFSSDKFIGAQPYPDETTMALIGAIIEHLGARPEAVLEAFGRHWVEYAAASPYGSLLDRTGGDLATFLANLDRMHASIKSTMPAASMPSFHVAGVADDRIDVEYRSARQGLAPFVKGLLAGLLDRFGQTGVISSCEGDGLTLFSIRLADA